MTSDDSWFKAPFLLDTGADRTVFSADVLAALHLQFLGADEHIGGVGGIVSSVLVETQLRLTRENGGKILLRGQYAGVTKVEALFMSVLGRNFTNLFAVIVEIPQQNVCLLGQSHQYAITLQESIRKISMTSYGLTDEVRALRERVKKFINEEVIPAEPILRRENAESEHALENLKRSAKQQGLWALGHPKEIGGGGVPFMAFVYLNEIIGRSYWGQNAIGSLTMQDSIMLHLYGTAEQNERWLRPLVAGEILPSVGLTEPEVAGSDPTLMQSTATLDGDYWVINAHKWFTTGANIAAFTTIFCQTEPDAQRHAKFSSIIVPTDTPGYEIVRVMPTMGHTGGNHCEIRLD